MSRPWMPLYIADYLADTAHLNAAQSGAYLHLIMHYWQHRKLPQDDDALARIAKMTGPEWRKSRPVVAPFFADGWVHGRIERELQEADRLSDAGRTGGRASGAARREKAAARRSEIERSTNDRSTVSERSFNGSANDQKTISEPLPSPSPFTAAGDARAISDHLPAAKRVWEAISIDPDDPTWFGQQHRIAQWLADWDLELDILPTIIRVMAKPHGKIRNLKYFEGAIADAHATRIAPLPAGTPQQNGGQSDASRGNVLPASEEIVAGIRAFAGAPSGRTGALRLRSDPGPDAVRLLPKGGCE